MAEHVPYQRSNAWESMDIKSLAQAIDTKFKEMTAMNDGDALKSASQEALTDFQTRNKELDDMRGRFKSLRDTDEMLQKQINEHKSFSKPAGLPPFQTGNTNPTNPQEMEIFKSIGQRFVESKKYMEAAGQKSWSEGTDTIDNCEIGEVSIKSVQEGLLQEALKTTMTTTAGWAPYPTLSPRPVVLSPQIPPVVADLIPQDDTDQPAILWYEETTYTNAAAPTAEGIAKPEATLATTLRNQPVVKIAVTLPVTDEQLMDVPQIRSYIDQRLTMMVKQTEQVQLLTGNGTAPNLQGFHTKAGIGSLARASNEDNADTILRAITQVNSVAGYANTTGIILNPLQWLAIRLVRTTTGDYIWGHPALQGPATLWGLPVIATNAETNGKAMVGDFQMYSHISRRVGLRIDVGYINTDFTQNIQRIRLEERLSLEIYRALAFCEATNLNTAP
jgi:HK97 family phage major capsid protein